MAEPVFQETRPVRRGPYPEITWPAILVGYLLGSVIALSIGYLSLKLGFSIEGSELAAILGFGILRGLMGRNSIIENNINQTLASAVNGASAGMMFSVPALFILGYEDFSRPLVVLGSIAGGILGIAFIIPLRKQMIDYNRLAFPGGIATAAVLRAPGAGVRKAVLLLGGAAASAGAYFVTQATGVENWNLGAVLGMPGYMNGIWYLSLLTIGTAYLAGRGGFFFVIGGYVCYWVLAPLLAARGLLPDPATAAAAGGVADWLRLNLFRPVGIGMLIGGALMGIVLALPLVVSAIRSMQSAAKTKTELSQDEMPIKFLYIGIAGAFVALLVIAVMSVQEMGIGARRADGAPRRAVDLGGGGGAQRVHRAHQLVAAVRHDADRHHHPDLRRLGPERPRDGGGVDRRRRRDVRRHGAGDRPDARSQGRLPGRRHPAPAADRAVPRHLAGADPDHGADRRPPPRLHAWAAPSCRRRRGRRWRASSRASSAATCRSTSTPPAPAWERCSRPPASAAWACWWGSASTCPSTSSSPTPWAPWPASSPTR